MRKLFSVLVFICLLTACSSDDDPISYGNPSVELSTEETEEFSYGESREFPITLKEVASTSFELPNGWEASIKDSKLTVTAPEKGKTGMSSNGTIEITATGLNETTVTTSINILPGRQHTEIISTQIIPVQPRNYIKAIMTYLPTCFSIQRPKDMVLHPEELPSRNGITKLKLTI